MVEYFEEGECMKNLRAKMLISDGKSAAFALIHDITHRCLMNKEIGQFDIIGIYNY